MRLHAKSALAVAISALVTPALAATDAQRIDMLEKQLQQHKAVMEQQQQMLEAMDAKLKRLKGEDTAQIATESAQTPVTNTAGKAPPAAEKAHSFQLYANIQLDAIYDFKRVDPTWESTLRPSTIPVESGAFGDDGNTVFSVKQTQLGFKGLHTTPLGSVKSWFEFDFFGTGSDAGDTKFNLRHAWVEVGSLGFGQTNSTFMDISIFPNVIDWWGPSGMAFNRNPQLRYTWFGEETQLAVALEKPNGSFNTGIFGTLSPEFNSRATDRTPLPDLTAHWRSEGDWGHYQIAGVLRQLEYETRGTANNKPNGEDTGWGVNLTSVINTSPRNRLKLGLVYGEGIASFMNDGGVNLAPENFEGEAVPVLGVTAYYDHYWSDQWSSSIGYSLNKADPRNQQADFEFEAGSYSSVNLLYTPYPDLLIGSEFLWGNHENVAGEDADDYRIQFSLKHKFGARF